MIFNGYLAQQKGLNLFYIPAYAYLHEVFQFQETDLLYIVPFRISEKSETAVDIRIEIKALSTCA